jgi:hypothetical protein
MNLIATPAQPEKIDLGSLGINHERGGFETLRFVHLRKFRRVDGPQIQKGS